MVATPAASTVSDVMSKDPVTISPDAPVTDLVDLLAREGIGGVPVVEEDRVVGVVSSTDVLRLASEGPGRGARPSTGADAAARRPRGGEGQHGDEAADTGFYRLPDGPPWFPKELPDAPVLPAFEGYRVGDIMSSWQFSVRPDAPVARVARLLLEARLHRALVMERRRLVGIVTTFDLIRLLAEGEEGGSEM